MGALIWIVGIALVVIILTAVLNGSYTTQYTTEDLEVSEQTGEVAENEAKTEEEDSGDSEAEDEEGSAEANQEETPGPSASTDTDSSVTSPDVSTTTETGSSEEATTTSSQQIDDSNGRNTGDTPEDAGDTEEAPDTLQAEDLLDLEDESVESDEDAELPFEPIHTFEPNPDQWSTLSEETSRVPWTEKGVDESDYDDTVNPTPPSDSIEEAIEWLDSASTEAIHQEGKRRQFLDYLRDFIEQPRAAGAQYIEKLEWRDNNPNISRLIGDRLLLMALGLSCHGHVEMRSHLEALGECLNDTWNNDGLEHPLVHQSIGRLGILTPTSLEDVQPTLTNRVAGQVPRSSNPGIIDEASFHAMLLAVAPGPDYPLKNTDDNLPRTWHWDGNNPPLASWNQLLPILYSLWIYHWTQENSGGAVKDIGPMLGSWWEENPPSEGFFDNNPEVWEGILMFTWATAGRQSHVWEQLRDRYEEINVDDNLRTMTETYFEWADSYQDEGRPPRASFTGKRMPPLAWIKPLPSDIVQDFSQPSHDFPESWCNQLTEMAVPDTEKL